MQPQLLPRTQHVGGRGTSLSQAASWILPHTYAAGTPMGHASSALLGTF
jgi:hypothetical protein